MRRIEDVSITMSSFVADTVILPGKQIVLIAPMK